jgi:GT2 family glycosyltransferase
MSPGKNAPSVHIILLNWNGWRDTLECLSSLRKLDYPNCRILVVDNGSSDDSEAMIRSAEPKIELIQAGANRGFGSGNNIGMRVALACGADYVWLLNNDTLAEPSSLTYLVEEAEFDSGVGAVGSVLYFEHAPSRIQAWGGGYVNMWLGISRHHTTAPAPGRLHYLTAASILLRRKALKDIGLFDEGFFMYWEDADLGFRLRQVGWKLAVAEKSHVIHKHAASMGSHSPILAGYYNSSACYFFRKHSRLFPIPIVIGTLGRFLKRVRAADWEAAGKICRSR